MGLQWKFNDAAAMASPWRQRRMCILMSELPAPAALREISGAEAFLETNARPELGSNVQLQHPEAGSINAVVRSYAKDGVTIAFDCSAKSVAFALAAITADMSRPEA